MKKYTVTGMSCAACSARVEKAVMGVDGVSSCSVNLLTGSMSVEGIAENDAIITAVEKAGYGIFSEDAMQNRKTPKERKTEADSDESTNLVRRLLFSLVFLVLLMYFSMGHNMLGLPLPSFFEENPAGNALVQLLLSLVVVIINGKFFISGAKSILRLSPNMDALVAIGSSAAFVYSTAQLFLMLQNPLSATSRLHGLYFESAAMILALITVGKTLEARSKAKASSALRELSSLSPEKATLERFGKEITVDISEVRVGDIFIVKPGEQVPVDGFVISGSTSINEAAITGESVPSEKKEGDTVTGATLNTTGYIKCRATRVGEQTVLSRIIRTVNDAASSKAPVAKAADKIAAVFVPAVMCIAVLTTVIWILLGETFGISLARGISVLVISCPCSLGLATPVAIMVGSTVGAKNSILYKNASMLEMCGRIKTVVLDKTGTVTSGNISVTGVYPAENVTEKELLSVAHSLEKQSEHPFAKAIVEYCLCKELEELSVSDFLSSTGSGVSGKIAGETVYGGKLEYVEKAAMITIPEKEKGKALEISKLGSTPLFFSYSGKYLGIISAQDTVKSDSKAAIEAFERLGIETLLLSGDNEEVTKAISERAGIKKFISGATPESKAREIEHLKKKGRVAMVGDGINDAPALALSDVGIAIGTGTDIARETAGVILMKGSLMEAVNALRLGRCVLKNIHENLFWAFIYNCIGIPVAAGVLTPFGITLSPMLAALAMGLSSFCVVSNALRINLFKPYKAENVSDTPIKAEENTTGKESLIMEKTLKIEGMMCAHCEAHIKKALEAIDGVEACLASHTEGTAVLTLSKDVPEEILCKAVEDEGYKVI